MASRAYIRRSRLIPYAPTYVLTPTLPSPFQDRGIGIDILIPTSHEHQIAILVISP